MSLANNETSIERGIRLGNYQKIDPRLVSEYIETGFVVDSILFEMQFGGIRIPSQGKYLNNLKEHVKVIILNLYDVYCSDPLRYVGYLRRSGAYKKKRGSQGFQLGYQNVRKVTDFLEANGYLSLDGLDSFCLP
jgi:hypothetical protein